MAEKDLNEKLLEDYNDVFADIYNVLVFGEPYLQAERICVGDGTSIYKTETGNASEQLRDVLKKYGEGRLGLLSLGIENQTEADETMPVRVMGYDYGSYRRMLKNGKEITPVTTIVLNFGDRRWRKAKSLHEMMNLPEKLAQYVEDYKIRVYDIAFLSDNIIEQFTSDFKIVARFFKDRRLKRNTLRKDEIEKIHHAEAVLDLFSVFTKDDRYRKLYTETVKEMEEKGERIDMCWMLQEIIDEGMEKGMKEGMEKGMRQGMKKGMRQGMEKGMEKGLAAMVNTLKTLVPDPEEIHRMVTANQSYAHISKEQILAYYEV